MAFNNTIAFLIALVVMFGLAQSLAQPSDSPDRGVALEEPAPALYRRTLCGGASLAVKKDQDGIGFASTAGMSQSATESPKEMSAPSTHSLHKDGFCPDCEIGSIDPNTPP